MYLLWFNLQMIQKLSNEEKAKNKKLVKNLIAFSQLNSA